MREAHSSHYLPFDSAIPDDLREDFVSFRHIASAVRHAVCVKEEEILAGAFQFVFGFEAVE